MAKTLTVENVIRLTELVTQVSPPVTTEVIQALINCLLAGQDDDNPTCMSCGQVIADHDESRETTEGWACNRKCAYALTGEDI